MDPEAQSSQQTVISNGHPYQRDLVSVMRTSPGEADMPPGWETLQPGHPFAILAPPQNRQGLQKTQPRVPPIEVLASLDGGLGQHGGSAPQCGVGAGAGGAVSLLCS